MVFVHQLKIAAPNTAGGASAVVTLLQAAERAVAEIARCETVFAGVGVCLVKVTWFNHDLHPSFCACCAAFTSSASSVHRPGRAGSVVVFLFVF